MEGIPTPVYASLCMPVGVPWVCTMPTMVSAGYAQYGVVCGDDSY